jgi:glutamyl-tRNA synthetase
VWTRWITALERATGRVGNALLPPLRLALTGEDSGPDLADLLPLIGRSRAAGRLRIAAA